MNTLVLEGDALKFWSSRSKFIHMLRHIDGKNRNHLVIDLNHIENPELLIDLINIDRIEKDGGVFVYNKYTGAPSINPKKKYNLSDVYSFLDYMIVENPRQFLLELANKQINRPRKLLYAELHSFNSNYNTISYNNNNNNNRSNNTRNNYVENLGYLNSNEEHAYSRISKKNRTKINKKNKTRRGKKSQSI